MACIVAALPVRDDAKREFIDWMLAAGNATCPTLGDATNISDLEAGRIQLKPEILKHLNYTLSFLRWPPLQNGSGLEHLRGRFGLSQTRFAAICIVANSNLPEVWKATFIQAIVANGFSCPLAGDYSHVSLLETGSKQLTRSGIQAFCKGFELLWGRTVTAEDLFDDWLQEMEEGECN